MTVQANMHEAKSNLSQLAKNAVNPRPVRAGI